MGDDFETMRRRGEKDRRAAASARAASRATAAPRPPSTLGAPGIAVFRWSAGLGGAFLVALAWLLGGPPGALLLGVPLAGFLWVLDAGYRRALIRRAAPVHALVERTRARIEAAPIDIDQKVALLEAVELDLRSLEELGGKLRWAEESATLRRRVGEFEARCQQLVEALPVPGEAASDRIGAAIDRFQEDARARGEIASMLAARSGK